MFFNNVYMGATKKGLFLQKWSGNELICLLKTGTGSEGLGITTTSKLYFSPLPPPSSSPWVLWVDYSETLYHIIHPTCGKMYKKDVSSICNSGIFLSALVPLHHSRFSLDINCIIVYLYFRWWP